MEKETVFKVTAIAICIILSRFVAQDIYMCKKYNGQNKYFDKDFAYTIFLCILVLIISLISCALLSK